MSPQVSVIVNCFNGEKYLRRALDSIICQTYHDLEVIFWDNMSTDRSAQIFKSYDDPRFRYFLAPRHTLLYEARNYAIEKARGSFIAFLDVDDWWLPNKLETQVARFSDPDVGVVCSNYLVFNQSRNRTRPAYSGSRSSGYVIDELLRTYYVGLLTLMIRKSALQSLPYACNPDYHVIGDFDLVIRLLVNWKLSYVDEPLAVFRLHGENESITARSRHIHELKQWVSKMKGDPVISKSKGFPFVQQYADYIRGMSFVMQHEKKQAILVWWRLPWSFYKFRLLAAILLPYQLVRSLKH